MNAITRLIRTSERTRSICLFGLVVGLCSGAVAHAQKPRQIAEKAFPSVVLLVTQDANGQTLALGSGFFVKEDIVASNFHVVEGATAGFAKVVGGKTEYAVAGIAAVDIEHDIVLLALKDVNGTPVTLGDPSAAKIGDEVYAVGNPMGLEGTFSAGIISGVRTVGSSTFLQITAPISPGSSGGPVLDAEGKVIGISTASYRGGQNLNFAVPASYLPLSQLGSKKIIPFKEWSRSNKKKSVLNDLGEKSTDGVVAVALEWSLYSSPSFSLKNQLLTPVSRIRYIITFYDKPYGDRKAEIVDYLVGVYDDAIPPKLSKRVIFDKPPGLPTSTVIEDNTVKVRILDFVIAE